MNKQYRQTRFVMGVPGPDALPADAGREVAFAGRSNSGKSSVINALTDQKALARTSKTPGRTQSINVFEVSDQRRLIDLPGYGYAKVPEQVKREWQRHLSDYLRRRGSLRGLVLVMDVRHPLTEFDETLLGWADEANMPVHILLTKADKLKSGAAKSALQQVRSRLREWEDLVSIQLFSALKKQGIEEVHERLDQWLLEPNEG